MTEATTPTTEAELDALMAASEAAETDARGVFDKYDVASSGFVEPGELVTMLRELHGRDKGDEAFESALQAAADAGASTAASGDGLTFEEFVAVYNASVDALPKEEDDKMLAPEALSALREEVADALRRFGGAYFMPRNETGYVGLHNQGATCYLNSLIQSLFMTPDFRAAVNAWSFDAERDGPEEECIPLQMQLLFGRLARSQSVAVFTRDLTTSFCWTGTEVFSQQDVSELRSQLIDALVRWLRGTGYDDSVSPLYRGSFSDRIKCMECGCESPHDEPFLDVALNIYETRSIEDALGRFCTDELMDGDNCWFCPDCDTKRPALKGIKFNKLGPLLGLHLKRFIFDYDLGYRVKLNQQVTFPTELDMAPYMSDSADVPADELVYELFAVLVHSGTALGGHYYALIKDLHAGGQWFTFNDAVVSAMTEEEVSAAFGREPVDADALAAAAEEAAKAAEAAGVAAAGADGAEEGKDSDAALHPDDRPVRFVDGREVDDKPPPLPVFSGTSTNAYMLMYRRKGLPLPEQQAPDMVLQRLAEENSAYTKLKAAYDLSKTYSHVIVRRASSEDSIALDLHMSTSLDNVLTAAADKLGMTAEGIAKHNMRLRRFEPSTCMPGLTYEGRGAETLEALDLHPNGNLLLETKAEEEVFEPFDPRDMHIIVQTYDLETHDRTTLNSVKVEGREMATLAALHEAVESKLGVPIARQRLVQLNGSRAVVLRGGDSVLSRDFDLWKGESVVLEDTEDAASDDSPVVVAYETLQNKITVKFNHPATPEEFTMSVETDKRHTLAQLKEAISTMIDMPPAKFHLRRNARAKQIKQEDQLLDELRMIDGSVIFVKKGPALKPDEFLVRFSVYDKVKYPKKLFKPLAQTGLHEERKLSDIKLQLSDKLSTPPSRIRIRIRNKRSVGKILRDNRTLRENVPRLADGLTLAVQLLEHDEVVTSKDYIIGVRVWHPLRRKLLDAEDFVVSKRTSVGQLKTSLIDRFRLGLPPADVGETAPPADEAEDAAPPAPAAAEGEAKEEAKEESAGPDYSATAWLGIAKGPSVGQLTLRSVKSLKWDCDVEAINPQLPINRQPLGLRDGSTLVIRDEQEQAQHLEALEAKRRAREGAGADSAELEAKAKKHLSSSAPRRRVAPERAMKIRTRFDSPRKPPAERPFGEDDDDAAAATAGEAAGEAAGGDATTSAAPPTPPASDAGSDAASEAGVAVTPAASE